MHNRTVIHPAGRRIARTLGGGILGIAAVVCVAAPPAAHAEVTRLGAMPDMNFGIATNYGSDCDYTLQADVTDPGAPVTFYDNGTPIGVARPGGAYALLKWTPAYSGQHTLSAVQGGQPTAATLVLPVGVGIRIGYACVVSGG